MEVMRAPHQVPLLATTKLHARAAWLCAGTVLGILLEWTPKRSASVFVAAGEVDVDDDGARVDVNVRRFCREAAVEEAHSCSAAVRHVAVNAQGPELEGWGQMGTGRRRRTGRETHFQPRCRVLAHSRRA